MECAQPSVNLLLNRLEQSTGLGCPGSIRAEDTGKATIPTPETGERCKSLGTVPGFPEQSCLSQGGILGQGWEA